MNHKFLYILLCAVLLVASCAKKGSENPVTKNTITQTTITTTVTLVTTPIITPHTDSFYGAILENDMDLPVDITANNGTYSRGNFIVYLSYYANGVILLTSPFNDSIPTYNCYHNKITYNCMVDTSGQYAGFKLIKDSLLFKRTEDAGTCADYFYILFAGNKILIFLYFILTYYRSCFNRFGFLR